MPGLLKVGYTNRRVETRVAELSYGYKGSSATGVPLPFEAVKQWRVMGGDTYQIEQVLHAHLRSHRVNRSREFFRLDEATAIGLIEEKLETLGLLGLAKADDERARAEAESIIAQRAAAKAAKDEGGVKAAAATAETKSVAVSVKDRAGPESESHPTFFVAIAAGAAWLMAALAGIDAVGMLVFVAFASIVALIYEYTGSAPKTQNPPRKPADHQAQSTSARGATNTGSRILIRCRACRSLGSYEVSATSGYPVNCNSCRQPFR